MIVDGNDDNETIMGNDDNETIMLEVTLCKFKADDHSTKIIMTMAIA